MSAGSGKKKCCTCGGGGGNHCPCGADYPTCGVEGSTLTFHWMGARLLLFGGQPNETPCVVDDVCVTFRLTRSNSNPNCFGYEFLSGYVHSHNCYYADSGEGVRITGYGVECDQVSGRWLFRISVLSGGGFGSIHLTFGNDSADCPFGSWTFIGAGTPNEQASIADPGTVTSGGAPCADTPPPPPPPPPHPPCYYRLNRCACDVTHSAIVYATCFSIENAQHGGPFAKASNGGCYSIGPKLTSIPAGAQVVSILGRYDSCTACCPQLSNCSNCSMCPDIITCTLNDVQFINESVLSPGEFCCVPSSFFVGAPRTAQSCRWSTGDTPAPNVIFPCDGLFCNVSVVAIITCSTSPSAVWDCFIVGTAALNFDFGNGVCGTCDNFDMHFRKTIDGPCPLGSDWFLVGHSTTIHGNPRLTTT